MPLRCRPLVSLLLLAACSGCAAGRMSRTDLDRQAACRADADRRFDRQNRYLLSESDQTGTPFSSRGFPGDTAAGLGDLYRRDRSVDNCMQGGEPVGPSPAH